MNADSSQNGCIGIHPHSSGAEKILLSSVSRRNVLKSGIALEKPIGASWAAILSRPNGSWSDPTGVLPLQQAWEFTRGGGHIVTLGFGQKGDVSFPAMLFTNRGRTVHSAQQGGLNMLRDLPRSVTGAHARSDSSRGLSHHRGSRDQV
jgi:hypothetical protein